MLIHIETAAQMLGISTGELFHCITRTGNVLGLKLPKTKNTKPGDNMPHYMFVMDEFIEFAKEFKEHKKSMDRKVIPIPPKRKPRSSRQK